MPDYVDEMPTDVDPFEGGTTRYQMNLIFLLDTSGSMYGERINQLNIAMEEAAKVAEETARSMEVQLFMRVITFNNDAHWVIGSVEHGVEHIDWEPVEANNGTATDRAIDEARKVMHRTYLGERNYRPVVILITDGESNFPERTVEAVNRLKTSLVSRTDPTKDKVMRIAIGVLDANQTELVNFASVGNIVHEDGVVDEHVPFVFTIDDINLLEGLLKSITVSSIASSIGAGLGDGSDDDDVVITLGGGDDDDDFVD